MSLERACFPCRRCAGAMPLAPSGGRSSPKQVQRGLNVLHTVLFFGALGIVEAVEGTD